MSFNDDVQLDTSQVESGGGGGRGPGGMVIGGGLGGIILLIVALIFGINPSDLPGTGTDPGSSGSVESGGNQSGAAFAECKTGADANKNDVCRVIGTVNSVQAYWGSELPRYGKEYPPAKTVLYKGATQSACGTASNQVGPFYCPLDKKVYIDADFFSILTTQFGSDAGALAQEYVVAHEYGHHIQDILGLLDRAQQDPKGAESGAVRIELMADCLAGVWAHHASTTQNAKGETYLKPLTKADIAWRSRRPRRRRRPHPAEDAGPGEPRVVDPWLGGGTSEVVPHGLPEGRPQLLRHLRGGLRLLTG